MIARHNIASQKSWVIGRHPQFAHVHSYHESISRQHSAIVYHPTRGHWFCIDLKSFHGTFIDGKRLEPWIPTEVCEGAKLTLGGSSRAYTVNTAEQGLEKEEDKNECPPPKKQKLSHGKAGGKDHERDRRLNTNSKEKEKERNKVTEKEEGPEKVQCSHLLVKHEGSRKPTSWRSKNITRTREEALELQEGYRSQIIWKKDIC